MAYSIISNWDKPTRQKRTFLCDARADISSLPTDVPVGSEAMVTADASVWILDNSKTWIEL
jgi:hypothetical protein